MPAEIRALEESLKFQDVVCLLHAFQGKKKLQYKLVPLKAERKSYVTSLRDTFFPIHMWEWSMAVVGYVIKYHMKLWSQ